MNKKRFSKNKKYAGFSYAESILAVFIVSFEMLVVASLMSSSLKESMDSRNQIIGVLLSQEGIELVRNLRDNNWAKGDDTFTGFPANTSNIRRIDIDSPNANGFGTYVLRSNNSTKAYKHSTTNSTATKFRRRIIITYYPSAAGNTTATSATIISAVTWNNVDPPSNPSASNCNSSAKCAYTTTTLTRWGGM
ncbi:MAG: hypothetical protein A2271_01045 [Candidatus Moranbacteria bacterium RIFOXYA12_FULL_35_19]|nr:MAG: hypothetical protein UR78_C0005G0029 [Candidatus Moranbacteria bacterium GW2011_GWF2_35_39]OGI32599.1 MAG: hypothetical protein A2489_02730 [Candidatus Moranbacteria bacterium RIFOXYC12_FULL_36_13]OGI32884.1 MAG: hypothetical protein A2343_02305 [Candidatus Moranbacteria bacterium RIFOXYB12_FULL_35_8]OGI36486.1 MAG: hypothetical protein A2271_01045 [Candidatus Moranbacteria bacterium RIFOXYA12_FULL_35_19]